MTERPATMPTGCGMPSPGAFSSARAGYRKRVATQVSERQSRRVAEETRETEWKLPSFCRELFRGALRVDLTHPLRRREETPASRGEACLRRLSQFLESEVDPLQI